MDLSILESLLSLIVRPTACEFIHFDECCNVTLGFDFITSAEREVKDRAAQERSKVATWEHPNVPKLFRH